MLKKLLVQIQAISRKNIRHFSTNINEAPLNPDPIWIHCPDFMLPNMLTLVSSGHLTTVAAKKGHGPVVTAVGPST
jgi:hypothetical protein